MNEINREEKTEKFLNELEKYNKEYEQENDIYFKWWISNNNK